MLADGTTSATTSPIATCGRRGTGGPPGMAPSTSRVSFRPVAATTAVAAARAIRGPGRRGANRRSAITAAAVSTAHTTVGHRTPSRFVRTCAALFSGLPVPPGTPVTLPSWLMTMTRPDPAR